MIIDQLPAITTPVQNGDEMPIERGTSTYKIDYNSLATAILNRIDAGSLSGSPSMLVSLASTTVASVMQASPRPGVTGTLPVNHGGTNATTATAARNNLGVYSKTETDSAIASSSMLNNGLVQFGRQAIANLAANAQTEVTVTLPTNYNGGDRYAAIVQPVVYTRADYIHCIIRSKTATGFVVRVYNASSSAITDAYLDWATFGLPAT